MKTHANCTRAGNVALFSLCFAAIVLAACGTGPAAAGNGAAHASQRAGGARGSTPLIEMVLVPAGTFDMGSRRGTKNSLDRERPVHRVTLQDFYLGKYEVTQGQYFAVTGLRPSHFVTNPNSEGQDGWEWLPVEMVNWYEALVFCNKLSMMENLDPVYRIKGSVNPGDWGNPPVVRDRDWDSAEIVSGANGYRLPTEAEWEYAARGGKRAKDNAFAGSDTVDTVAWHYGNSKNRLSEVGRKAPNDLDLYDMSGNVMEWCWDWYGDYTEDAQNNPVGPPLNTDPKQLQSRVIRGGAWSTSVHFGRVAYRHNNNPPFQAVNLGFRVAR